MRSDFERLFIGSGRSAVSIKGQCVGGRRYFNSFPFCCQCLVALRHCIVGKSNLGVPVVPAEECKAVLCRVGYRRRMRSCCQRLCSRDRRAAVSIKGQGIACRRHFNRYYAGCFVAALICGDNRIDAVFRQGESALAVCHRLLRTVQRHAVEPRVSDRNILGLRVSLAVCDSCDNGVGGVQNKDVRAEIGFVARTVGQSHINNGRPIGVERKGGVVGAPSVSFALYRIQTQIILRNKVVNGDRFAAVVGSRNGYILRFSEEQTEGNRIEKTPPAVFRNGDFSCGPFYVLVGGLHGGVSGSHGENCVCLIYRIHAA